MSNYWHPQYKWQLVEYFVSNNILTRTKANRMGFKNLYGKYKAIRERSINAILEKNVSET